MTDTESTAPATEDQKTTTEEKRFSQGEVDSLINGRLSREKKAFEKQLSETQRAAAEKAQSLEQQLAEINAKFEDAGKSGDAKELAELKRVSARSAQQLEEHKQSLAKLAKERDDAIASHRDFVVSQKATEALVAAGVIGESVADALLSFKSASTIEIGEGGTIHVTLNGKIYDSVKEAAESFLTSKPFFKKHPGGGAGTKNTSAGPSGINPNDMSSRDLISAGLRAGKSF